MGGPVKMAAQGVWWGLGEWGGCQRGESGGKSWPAGGAHLGRAKGNEAHPGAQQNGCGVGGVRRGLLKARVPRGVGDR
jgi:hypothetical protein